MSDLITIGLPVYNSERYLRHSLDSLLQQTYAAFTLVISDNASTDGTAEICKEYAAADSRIRYFRNPVNIGNPGNFNRVFSLCETKYLKWSTSDDYWAPTFLERALEVMERDTSLALCYPKTFVVDANGENATPYEDGLHLTQADPAERFLSLISSIGLAHQHLGLIRTSFLRQTHLLGAYVASDISLLAELTLYGGFYELQERLFYRRFHKTSGSWKRGDNDHQKQFYLAAKKAPVGFRLWRRYRGFFASVASSPLSPPEKWRIYRTLCRRMIWDRGQLHSEIASAVRSLRPSQHA